MTWRPHHAERLTAADKIIEKGGDHFGRLFAKRRFEKPNAGLSNADSASAVEAAARKLRRNQEEGAAEGRPSLLTKQERRALDNTRAARRRLTRDERRKNARAAR